MSEKKTFRVTVSVEFYEDMLRVQRDAGELGIQALAKSAIKQYIKRNDSRKKSKKS